MSTGFNMAEPSYIKDGTAKLVVEMVKREWPQQWPTFLQELTSLATRGNEYQIEVKKLKKNHSVFPPIYNISFHV